jgi:chromate transporter
VSRPAGLVCLALFFLLLLGLPLLAGQGAALALVDAFYRAGALVFGGGHVVLPLLDAETVARGWVSQDVFLAGYGAAQAVPGPLFTFAAYLGAVGNLAPNGILGAGLALVAIFLPGMLLLVGVLPFWDGFRTRPLAQAAMRGTNAAVVGILAAALYDPLWTGAVIGPVDVALALAGFLALVLWKAPPWMVVVALAVAGGALNVMG